MAASGSVSSAPPIIEPEPLALEPERQELEVAGSLTVVAGRVLRQRPTGGLDVGLELGQGAQPARRRAWRA